MKTGKERILLVTEHWANGAIAFGLGYWMLSNFTSGVALMIALALCIAGAFAKLVTQSRLKRFYEERASGDSSSDS
jgi:hypothetical protein